MVKLKRFFPLLLLVFILLLASPVYAEQKLVVDQAGLLTSAEIADLESTARALGEKYQMHIVIVTTDQAGGKSSMAYADDFFDYGGYGAGAGRDGILFLIDLDNRIPWISTSGSGIAYLTDKRIDSIMDDVYNFLNPDVHDYYGAANAFLSSTADFLAEGIPHNSVSLLDSILAATSGGLLGLGIFSGTKRQYRGKNTRPVFDYQKNGFVSMDIAADNLVNTFVTSRIIPQSTGGFGSSGPGGSSTHTSSSGRTHGGGGGRGF